jgi:drug/metabolite transporter (DMT)-like permease
MTKPKYYYFLILFFDTQTNFFKILALTKGDLSYPYVINSSSILFIALLTYFFIKKYKYTWKHFLATFLCIFGTILAFYGVLKGKDIQTELEENYYGFIFALISAICFTLTIIFMEIHFKNGKDIYDFFPYLGVFGTLIVFIESIIYFEINNLVLLQNFSIDLKHILFVLLFMVISLAIGTMVPFYIKRYSASIYNFFMVSQIFWSYIFKLIFDKKTEVSFHFYIGFSIILGSTILFSIFKLKKITKKSDKNVSLQNMNINLISSSERSTQL